MGRLWDKWLGTQYPDSDAVPLSAAEVRDALLAANSSAVPYHVRKANPWEKADLVAEWRIPPRSSFGEQVEQRVRIRMRLNPSEHEVRILQEQWTSARSQLSSSDGYSRGRGHTVERQWTYERGPDGRRRRVETYRLDTRDMRNALRKVVLSAGWTWRGVFKL
ncbi:hypothetical protein EKH77_11845 [Streptomyces luteoverticillatus]|uniref:Uncharacterized protein n=1 Tax=Streptomyces luteoverticillatus TaxID=66425 RepID=A0A3S9PHF2_STRLT|nr:hypothetical protein EKH77_11845 [Streptomyces luteoverticillatus]